MIPCGENKVAMEDDLLDWRGPRKISQQWTVVRFWWFVNQQYVQVVGRCGGGVEVLALVQHWGRFGKEWVCPTIQCWHPTIDRHSYLRTNSPPWRVVDKASINIEFLLLIRALAASWLATDKSSLAIILEEISRGKQTVSHLHGEYHSSKSEVQRSKTGALKPTKLVDYQIKLRN